MTTAELIAKLQEFPPDLPVVVKGFDEGGYSDISTFETVRIAPVKPCTHGPEFEDFPHYRPDEITGEPFDALLVNF